MPNKGYIWEQDITRTDLHQIQSPKTVFGRFELLCGRSLLELADLMMSRLRL